MPRLGFPTPYDNLDVFCVFDFWLRVSESVSSLSLKLPEAKPILAGQAPASTVGTPEKEHRHKCRQSFSSLLKALPVFRSAPNRPQSWSPNPTAFFLILSPIILAVS